MIERLAIRTASRQQMIDITPDIDRLVASSGVTTGVCFVFTPHTTAAITINENADPAVKSDILRKLEQVFPQQDNFRHAEGNSDAHIKSSLVGCSETVLIEDGRLLLGTWQGVFFCEFDGPRRREVFVRIAAH